MALRTGRGHFSFGSPLLPSLRLWLHLVGWSIIMRKKGSETYLTGSLWGRIGKVGGEDLRILSSAQSNQIESSLTLRWPIAKEEPWTSQAEARALG